MIKILHIADIHLGMENYGKMSRKTGLNSRLLDFLKNFDYAINYAIDKKIDFFFFAGDAFKTREPTQTQQREFAKRIKKISSAGIPVILVVGNHDLPNAFGKADTLEIYKTLEVDNVYISKNPEVYKFIKINNQWKLAPSGSFLKNYPDAFQVATLPWISKSSITTKEDYKNKSIGQVNKMVTAKISANIKSLAANIDNRCPSAIIAHATVAGAEFGAERKVYFGTEIALPVDLFLKPWGYAALGHLHKYQVLSQDPPVIYAGSIDRVDFSEEKEGKGFVVADINPNEKTKYEFIEAPARKFVLINILINDGDNDPMQKIEKEISKYNIKKAVVKINIEVPKELANYVNSQKISRMLENAHHIASINKQIIMPKEMTIGLGDFENFTPLKALEKYLNAKYFNRNRKKAYYEYAKKIIESLDE